MTESSSPSPANLGSLGIQSVLSTAPVLNIIAEWASVVPLACHIGGKQQDYALLGELALTGKLSVGLFEELGFAKGVARLLKEGPDFLDRASVRGDVSWEVWDVNWGSTFLCSNGAACATLTAYALRKVPRAINISDCIQAEETKRQTTSTSVVALFDCSSTSAPFDKLENGTPESGPHIRRSETFRYFQDDLSFEEVRSPSASTLHNRAASSSHRRYQRLHILDFQRRDPSDSNTHRVRLARIEYSKLASSIAPPVVFVLLIVLGLYGTALAIFGASVSKIIAYYSIRPQRPPGYLTNNEVGDACMLMSTHRNATTWYLYTGDRGIVDHFLNKPMVELQNLRPHLLQWFKVSHIAQLIAMTYVTAQKGWDGIAMVILMLCAWLMKWCWGDDYLARQWLVKEGISVRVKSFDFEGRTAMISAIQALSESKVTRWMDDIIVPHPRRDALLSSLGLGANEAQSFGSMSLLSGFDQEWVALHVKRVSAAATIMLHELGTEV